MKTMVKNIWILAGASLMAFFVACSADGPVQVITPKGDILGEDEYAEMVEKGEVDDQGNVIGEWVCAPNTDCIGINIPAGQWHNLVCLESGTVLFESKDGPWSPLADEDILHPDC